MPVNVLLIYENHDMMMNEAEKNIDIFIFIILLRTEYLILHVPILFYNNCSLNYLYLNFQSPFSCSLAIISTIK